LGKLFYVFGVPFKNLAKDAGMVSGEKTAASEFLQTVSRR